MKREPILHSHITDVLPEDHPLAYKTVFCVVCGEMVHAFNNECMQTWAETGIGPVCYQHLEGVLHYELGLPDNEVTDAPLTIVPCPTCGFSPKNCKIVGCKAKVPYENE